VELYIHSPVAWCSITKIAEGQNLPFPFIGLLIPIKTLTQHVSFLSVKDLSSSFLNTKRNLFHNINTQSAKHENCRNASSNMLHLTFTLYLDEVLDRISVFNNFITHCRLKRIGNHKCIDRALSPSS